MVMEGRDEGKIGEVLEVNKVHLHCTVSWVNLFAPVLGQPLTRRTGSGLV